MGSQYVDGTPSWDSISSNLVSSFQGAPNKALQGISAADQIWINRREEMRKKAEFDAATAAGAAGAAALPMSPIATTPYDAIGPMVGDVNNPAQTAGIPRQSLTYAGPEDVARAEKDRLFFGNAIKAGAYKNPATLPELYAKGSVGVSGVPKTPDEIARLEFLTKGQVDRTKPDNYVAVDPNTGNTIRILGPGDGTYSADGQTKLSDLAPPGSVIMKAGETSLSAKPRTMLDDAASRQNALLDATIQIGNGALPNKDQTTRLEMALRTEYPEINRVMQDAIGNSSILHGFVEKLPPGPLKPLMEHIARTNYPRPAAPAAAPGSVSSTGAAPVTGTSSGGLAGVPTAVTAAPPPTPILPGYDTDTPPRSTILSEAPATEQQIKAARALGAVREARANIERLMGVTYVDGKAQMSPGAYTPDWMSGLVKENTATGTIQRVLLNKLDPKALEYFNNANAAVEPIVRIASGAVVPPAELINYMQMFIPNAQDSDALKAQKLTQLRVWEDATSTAGSANQAIAKILDNKNSSPEMRNMAEQLRVRAREAGTLNARPDLITGTPSAGTGAVTVGPAAATAAEPAAPAKARLGAPAGIPAPADRVVGQKYPTPKGPMTWTGPEGGWQP